MNKFFTFLVFSIFSTVINAQDISGKWLGILETQGITLDFGFNITQEGTTYSTVLDVPKQGLSSMKLDTTTFINDSLTIAHPFVKLVYKGKLTQQNEIEGIIELAGKPYPMNLKKGEITMNRPQEPKTPLDYYSEDITFKNEADDITLSGTLTLPNKKGKFPVAIIISGSGPQNRDGHMYGHKPYFVIADQLTKNGIGVLRFDERGVGASQGDFASASIEEFSADVQAAIQFLKGRKEIKSKKIGLIGHSIGGIIAPKVASENNDITFIVMLAGPGIDGDKLMLSQKAAIERSMGANEAQIAQGQDMVKGAYDIIVTSNLKNETLKDSIHSFYENKYGKLFPKAQRNPVVDQMTSPEFLSLIKSKPSLYLSKVKCPILALNGTKDLQVPAAENLEAIERIATENGNKKVTTMAFENLNHLFQECETGNTNEYFTIEQTVSPLVLETLTTWIQTVTK